MAEITEDKFKYCNFSVGDRWKILDENGDAMVTLRLKESDRARAIIGVQVANINKTVVIVENKKTMSTKNKSIAFLLAFFLGLLGIHRFYAGKGGTGATMLILTVTQIGLIVTLLWWVIDLILILSNEFRDSQGEVINKW